MRSWIPPPPRRRRGGCATRSTQDPRGHASDHSREELAQVCREGRDPTCGHLQHPFHRLWGLHRIGEDRGKADEWKGASQLHLTHHCACHHCACHHMRITCFSCGYHMHINLGTLALHVIVVKGMGCDNPQLWETDTHLSK